MVLAVVLLCVSIALMLATVLTRAVAVQHQFDRTAEHQQQCVWLAESGLQRARARLAQSADYRGELWEIGDRLLGNPRHATVQIRVEPGDPPAGGWNVAIEARCGTDGPMPAAVCQKQLFLSSGPFTDPGDQL